MFLVHVFFSLYFLFCSFFLLSFIRSGAEGNGCIRYVEIATQTMNLTNILTNLNGSLTNSNNTSEPCSEQNVSPTTSTTPPPPPQPTLSSPPPPPIPSQLTKLSDDPLDVNHHHQSSNSKSNNGHCIRTDSNAKNNDAGDDEMAHVSEVHHQSPETMCCVGVSVLAADNAHATDVIINMDDNGSSESCGDDGISKQHNTSEIQSEIIASDITGIVKVAPETATKTPPTEADSTADESLDISKKHTSTDGINGPANDVRV